MSEIMRLLLNEKKSRPWDTKLGNERIRRAYTIEMDKDGRYEVIETLPNAETHHSNFANKPMQKLGPLTGAIRLLFSGNVGGPREGCCRGLDQRRVRVRFPELRRI